MKKRRLKSRFQSLCGAYAQHKASIQKKKTSKQFSVKSIIKRWIAWAPTDISVTVNDVANKLRKEGSKKKSMFPFAARYNEYEATAKASMKNYEPQLKMNSEWYECSKYLYKTL